MSKENDILTELVTSIRADVANSLQEKGRFASGHTIEELQVVNVNESKVQLEAAPWTIFLETGRPPTSPDAPKGDPTVFQRIQEWIAFKGTIPASAAYAITQKIHKQGYKGTPGVLSNPLSDDNIDKRANEVAENLANLLITDFLKL